MPARQMAERGSGMIINVLVPSRGISRLNFIDSNSHYFLMLETLAQTRLPDGGQACLRMVWIA